MTSYVHKTVERDGDWPASLDLLIAINFITNESASRPDQRPRGRKTDNDGYLDPAVYTD